MIDGVDQRYCIVRMYLQSEADFCGGNFILWCGAIRWASRLNKIGIFNVERVDRTRVPRACGVRGKWVSPFLHPASSSPSSSQHASQLSEKQTGRVTGHRPPLDTCCVFRNWYQSYRILQRCTFSSGSLRLQTTRYSSREQNHIFDSESKSKRYTSHKQLLPT